MSNKYSVHSYPKEHLVVGAKSLGYTCKTRIKENAQLIADILNADREGKIFRGINPGVDAVEVIRCKDCRFFIKDEGLCAIRFSTKDMPLFDKVSENDYCSSAKRR